MNTLSFSAIVFSAFLFAAPAFAEDLDAASQQALQQTQDLMKNDSARQQVIDQSPELRKMDGKVGDLVGSPANKDKMYDISAGVMKKLTEEGGGDPEKMKALLEEAQKNPEKFFNDSFSADQQKAVRDIANDIQKNQPVP